jgi:Raf kinase inhibitor-like YbhB/YbcL family protein
MVSERILTVVVIVIILVIGGGIYILRQPTTPPITPGETLARLNELKITSPAFENNAFIPKKYTCDGDDVNPPLRIETLPVETKSIVLIVDDPDAPKGNWNHWIVWNIPPMEEIAENTVPGVEGMNDFQKQSYSGPCPPSGTHRYFFKVYALKDKLDLDISSQKSNLEKAMEGKIVAKGELIGLYSRD